MRSLLIGAALAALANPASGAPDDELSIGVSSRQLRSSSANAVTEQDLGGGELVYARDIGDTLGIAIHPRLSLWGDASYRWGDAEGMMFRTLSTRIDTDELALGGRVRYALHRRIVASARLGVGTARTELRLVDAQGHRNGDSRWAGTAATSVALDLMAVARSRFGLGMRVELGYVTATAPEMTARSEDGDDGTIMLPVEQVSFGHLDLGGRYLTVAWFGQF